MKVGLRGLLFVGAGFWDKQARMGAFGKEEGKNASRYRSFAVLCSFFVAAAAAQEPPGKITHWWHLPSSLGVTCPLVYDYCGYEEGCADALNGMPVPCTGEGVLYQPDDWLQNPEYHAGHLHPRNTVESLGGL